MSTPNLQELARLSSFVFSGTVEQAGASNVAVIDPTDRMLLVRIERPLRASRALGDLRGRLVTVETEAADDLQPGASAVFFADSWLQGEQIAVRERAHVAADRVDEVAAAVASLPDVHLEERLRDARAVVHAAVTGTRPVVGVDLGYKDPGWTEASLEVFETLKGDVSGMRLVFPTSKTKSWFLAPRFTSGQRGVFLLHVDAPGAEKALDDPALEGAVTAFDKADVQPESQLEHVRSLLAGLGAP
jgi:hypothetical protein